MKKTWNDVHELMSVSEASEILGVSAEKVRTMCREGQLPSVTLGKRVKIPKETLREIMYGKRCSI